MRLLRGSIPITEAEEEGLRSLAACAVVSYSRRDPGGSGPLVVELADGARMEIDEEGKARRA